MGLINGPAKFATQMNDVLKELIDTICVVYMDDILIYSKTETEHYEHIKFLLAKLRYHNQYIAPSKCSFMKGEVEFLGIIVNKDGLKVNLAKADRSAIARIYLQVRYWILILPSAVRHWTKSKSVHDGRSFMGLVSFFRRFSKDFGLILRPLIEFTKKGISIAN